MRLVTFVPPEGPPRAGALLGATVVDLSAAAPLVIEEGEGLRWDMLSLLRGDPDQEEVNLDTAGDIVGAVAQMAGIEREALDDPLLADDLFAFEDSDDLAGSLSIGGAAMLLPLSQVRLLAPLPRPSSLRSFFAFEGYLRTLYGQRGEEIPAEWYRFPAFAFGNHGAILGADEELPMPRSEALDYGLGLAIVIGRAGRDIAPEDAAEHIAGFMIVNEWSARDIAAEERALGLGLTKARDFATSLGPWLVTADELELYTADDGRLALTMLARVNGAERSRANAASIYYTFAELVAQASRDVTLYPGDVLGSGTVGGGSLLELNGPFGPWLERDDVVELEVTGLGVLRNRVV